jgi:hypothetical protein
VLAQNGDAHGGAIMSTGELRVASSTFWTNHAIASGAGQGSGGGVHHVGGDTHWVNVLFRGNQVDGQTGTAGGALASVEGSANLVNSTLLANSACGAQCGAIAGGYSFRNGILWESGWLGAPSALQHSCVQNGNFDESNPQQTNRDDCAPAADGTLGAGSTAIDRGNVALLPADADDLDGDDDLDEPIPFDRNGDARVSGLGVDMGAFERP